MVISRRIHICFQICYRATIGIFENLLQKKIVRQCINQYKHAILRIEIIRKQTCNYVKSTKSRFIVIYVCMVDSVYCSLSLHTKLWSAILIFAMQSITVIFLSTLDKRLYGLWTWSFSLHLLRLLLFFLISLIHFVFYTNKNLIPKY